MALLVDREVARLDHAFAGARVGLADLLLELRHDRIDAHVHLGMVFGLAADDQRRARLVDQDRVDLVDDGVVQPARDAVGGLLDHVVAQVVEAELVVGAVGHVRPVRGLLLLARHLRRVHAHRQAHEGVQAPHPLGVAPGEVVVHRHHVHALAGDGVQVHRQRGHQRLAFAGAHLGDLAVVQRHAAEQLNVEVAHPQRALAALANSGEGLGQQRVERLALGEALAELVRLRLQRLVGQGLEARLQRVDLSDDAPVLFQQTFVAAAENGGEKLGQHAASGLSGRRARRLADQAVERREPGGGAAPGRCKASGAWKTPKFTSGAAAGLALSAGCARPWRQPPGPRRRRRGTWPDPAARLRPAPRSAGAARSNGRNCPLRRSAGRA